MRRVVSFVGFFASVVASLPLFAAGPRFVEKLKAGERQTIVCYGTSLTAKSHWWVDGLREELAVRWPGKATVVNAGLSGKNSATGLANVQAKVVAERPDVVFVEFSMNDAADSLNAGKTADQAIAVAESNLKAILSAIKKANPECEIILETMNPYLAVAGSGLSNRTALDRHVAMYRRVATEEGYLLIDNWPRWQEVFAKGADEYRKLVPDGVHPNERGSRMVTLPNVLGTLGLGVTEPVRNLPVIKDVDVLVVGGTYGAVSAAVAAKEAGSSVFLVAPRRNLGEEIVLPRRLSGRDAAASVRPRTPLAVEKELDAKLSAAKVPFFTGAQACDVLRAKDGSVSGVVFADKSGRQVVRAKTVIDATDKGVVARKVATLRPVAADNAVAFTHTMTAKAGLVFDLPGYTVTEGPAPVSTITLDVGGDGSMIPKDAEKSYPASTYTFTRSFPLTSGDWLAVNAIIARIKTDCWTSSAADLSEVPFYVTPERMIGEASAEEMSDPQTIDLGVFRPQGVKGLYAIGQIADMSRAAAEHLSDPAVETALGARIGQESSRVASTRGAGTDELVSVPARGEPGTGLEVRERLARPLGIGADQEGTLTVPAVELPELARADIAIVGMGTSGGPAAIAALQKGRSVVGIDFLHTTGGVTTEGRIGKYYKGCNRGFTKNVLDPGTLATGWIFSVAKAEWFRRSVVTNALARVIFGTQAEGVLVDGKDAQGRAKVKGLVVVLPDGTRGIVRAEVVLDCTGNAEVAHMAGCRTQFLDAREFSMQGAGTTYHVLGNSYFNTDFGFLNTSDAGDLSNFARRALAGAKSTRYNVGDPSVSSRERRRIVGDIVVNERDILRRRKWSDTIMHGRSDYDMHGFSISDTLMYRERPHGTEFSAELPYRALIPAELEGVLTTGLAISATRDAMPIIRMQRDVQNQGYAAGLAASMALSTGSVRMIDIRALQKELVKGGTLDASVLTDTDEPVTDAALAAAVKGLSTETFAGLEKILERPEAALPLLQKEYAEAIPSAHSLATALALVLVGDNQGLDEIIEAVDSADWSKGFDFRGLGNYGRQTAPIDYLIHALVTSGDTEKVVPVLKNLLAKLTPTSKLSHFRLLTLAADDLKAPALQQGLAEVVARNPALMNKTVSTVSGVPVHDMNGKDNTTDDAERTKTMIELTLARALHNAGDETGTVILTAYLDDVRTIYADWAKLALAGPGRLSQP